MLQRIKRRRFEVAETFCEGKFGPLFPEKNQDRYYAGPRHIAVFDGVSGPHGDEAARLACSVLTGLAGDDGERTYAHMVQQRMLQTFGIPQKVGIMPASTAAILSRARSEVWMYGDVHAVEMLRDGAVVRHNVPIAEARCGYALRARLNRMRLASGEITDEMLYEPEHDLGRMLLGEVHKRQHVTANTEGGYTVLCAKPVPAGMARVVRLLPETARLVLASDGYPVELMDDRDLASVDTMERKLAEINAADPHCMGLNLGAKGITVNPDTGALNSTYDDRTVVIIDVL